MDSNNFEPLKITAYLRSAVVSDQFLPFDGLLYYQVHREIFGAQEVTVSGGQLGRNKTRKLPLAIANAGTKDWYYKASWAQWGPYCDGKDYWNKRFDAGLSSLIEFSGRGKINNMAGPTKAYHMPVFYRSALWVVWHCVGDRNEIVRLLATLTNIGKKGAQGWGRVARWDVSEALKDLSTWDGEKLMRGIPVDEMPAGYYGLQAVYGVRPSYWNIDNRMELVMP